MLQLQLLLLPLIWWMVIFIIVSRKDQAAWLLNNVNVKQCDNVTTPVMANGNDRYHDHWCNIYFILPCRYSSWDIAS